jgi:co-chaperonin GroES (HSP10)
MTVQEQKQLDLVEVGEGDKVLFHSFKGHLESFYIWQTLLDDENKDEQSWLASCLHGTRL